MDLPPLYKKTSTGADQMWQIATWDNVIVTRFGQLGGKIQETRDVIKAGKNIGRSNETSPREQAEVEAQAQWEKKKTTRGYVESLSDARQGKVDALVEGGITPMLAHKFAEQGHKIIYPAYLQPKLDGHRCVAVIKDGSATLWSRTRKSILSMPHIVGALKELALIMDLPNMVLDGELYLHSHRDRFEELTSLIRPDEPKPGHSIVEYHIFDKVEAKIPFLGRFHLLMLMYAELRRIKKASALQIVKTIEVVDEDELMLAFEDLLVQGYEGGIVRNAAGLYVNKRSYDIQKIKTFDDEEFVVVGVEEGRGKLAGHGIFVCKTREGIEFRAKMKGDMTVLKEYYERPRAVIGKLLTVKFQGFTQKNSVPRFPVALHLRDNI